MALNGIWTRRTAWASAWLLVAGCVGASGDDSPGPQFTVAPPETGSPQGNAGFGAVAGAGGAAGAGALPTTAGMGGGTSDVTTGMAGTGGMNMGGAGGMAGMAGMGGMGGMGGGAGSAGVGGMGGSAGMMTAGSGGGGDMMVGGPCGSGTPTDGRPTSGPLACIVEQHNAVRAMVDTATPLPPVTWSEDLAAYAQEWTDQTCTAPQHRSNPTLNGQRLGENLYASSGFGGGADAMPGKNAVDGWAGEVACYTFGTFLRGDQCDMSCTSAMHSDGCGHYTQMVWRASVEIGCGVTTCGSGFSTQTEVICNYAPAGNFVGMNPY